MNSNHRVLVISSDKKLHELADQYLSSQFVLDTASENSEAISKIDNHKGNFDVVVLDTTNQQHIAVSDINKLFSPQYSKIKKIIILPNSTVIPDNRNNRSDSNIYCYMREPIDITYLKANIHCAIRDKQEQHYSLVFQTLVREGQRLGDIKSNEDLYKVLYEEAKLLLPGLDGFLISHYEAQDHVVSFPFCYIRGERKFIESRNNGNSITEFVIQTQAPLLLSNGDRDFRNEKGLNPPSREVDYCASEITVPMFLDKQIIGTINAITYDPNIVYSEDHLQILQAFANQAAEPVRNIQQLLEAKQLRDAALVLSGKRQKDEVIRAIVDEAHKLIGADFTGLILQDFDGTLRKVRPVIPETSYDLFDEPRQQGGVTRKVVESRQPMVIRNTQDEMLVKDSVRKLNIRSMLALPLVHANWVFGVLYAHTISPRYFNAHDVDLWATFATQAAAALDFTLDEERYIRDYVKLANELGTLNEKMDLRRTGEHIATAAKNIFDSDTCRLAYVDPPTETIVDWSWAEGDPQKYKYEGAPRPEGLTYHVLNTKKPIFRSVGDSEKPSPIPELVDRGLKSVASLPLIYSGRIIGILHCNYLTKQRPFDERLKTLMEAFVARAAMALDRARRDQISQTLHELNQLIVAFHDLQELLRSYTEQAFFASRADLAIFCPYKLSSTTNVTSLFSDECKVVGDHQIARDALINEYIEGIVGELDGISGKPIIVNDIEKLVMGKYKKTKRLAVQEKFHAFVAIPMSIMSQSQLAHQLVGLLLLFFKGKTAYDVGDLSELQYASNLIAASIIRQELQVALQKVSEQRNQQLRAVVDVFRTFIKDGKGFNLTFIAQYLTTILGLDICTILEYDYSRGIFIRKGTSGERYPDAYSNINKGEFYERFSKTPTPTIIPDVQSNDITRSSKYVSREEIKSSVIFSLRVEGEFLGLLFANYRTYKDFSVEEVEAINLFCDLAAIVIHESKLGAELNETQKKLSRRFFLVWVSMIEASWRHSLVQKASAIRLDTAIIQKQISQVSSFSPHNLNNIFDTITDIDRLAAKIANAPPRIPQSWEMTEELIPLESLLEETAQRENNPAAHQTGPLISIRTDTKDLGNAEVAGYRAWLIYALEALFQNARGAMPKGGEIFVSGIKNGGWAEIRIRDTGNGVPEAIRDRLFKEPTPKKHDMNGMGIGGLLVATIVEDHKGNIELENPGPGNTTVLVRLPITDSRNIEHEY